MLTGNISIVYADPTRTRQLLERLGVQVGTLNPATLEFEGCRVSDEAMSRLDHFWGPLVWVLTPEKT